MEKNENIIAAVMEKTYKDGEKLKINCANALHIAAQFNIKPSEVGGICNDHKIRIAQCQLGCFK